MLHGNAGLFITSGVPLFCGGGLFHRVVRANTRTATKEVFIGWESDPVESDDHSGSGGELDDDGDGSGSGEWGSDMKV